MSVTVRFLPQESAAVIGKRKYTLEQLLGSSDKFFKNVAVTLQQYIEVLAIPNPNQLDLFNKDELAELVASDVAKGDYHSLPLIQ